MNRYFRLREEFMEKLIENIEFFAHFLLWGCRICPKTTLGGLEVWPEINKKVFSNQFSRVSVWMINPYFLTVCKSTPSLLDRETGMLIQLVGWKVEVFFSNSTKKKQVESVYFSNCRYVTFSKVYLAFMEFSLCFGSHKFLGSWTYSNWTS